MQNFSFHDTSMNSHAFTEDPISSNGASPSNGRLNNLYNTKETTQLAYMTLKVRTSEKKFMRNNAIPSSGSNSQHTSIVLKNSQLPPSQTPDLIIHKNKNIPAY
jgi:hypothetical protein